MKIICATVILFALLCFTRITTSQDTPHIIPSRLIFNTYSFGTDAKDNKLAYVDPHQRFAKTLINFDEGDRPDRAFYSNDGEKLAVVIRPVGKTTSDLCIYTASGEKNQCHEINLWGFNTLYYPIVWSADDTQISFIMTTENENPQIGVLDLTTDAIVPHPIPLYGAKFYRAYWSLGGEYLLYQTKSESNSETSLLIVKRPLSLYLMDVKNEKTRLVTTESHDSCVAWLNNTSQFGLLTDEAFTIRGLTDKDSVSVQTTYKGSDVSGCPFSFSNDNTQIAFHGVLPSDATFGVFVASLSDGKSMLIDDGYYSVNMMAWSPDDQFIAVEVQSGTAFIKVLSFDGWKQLYYDPDGVPLVGPAWQPIK